MITPTEIIAAWTILGAVAFFAIGGTRGSRWKPGQWVALAAICGPGMWIAVAWSTTHIALKARREALATRDPMPQPQGTTLPPPDPRAQAAEFLRRLAAESDDPRGLTVLNETDHDRALQLASRLEAAAPAIQALRECADYHELEQRNYARQSGHHAKVCETRHASWKHAIRNLVGR